MELLDLRPAFPLCKSARPLPTINTATGNALVLWNCPIFLPCRELQQWFMARNRLLLGKPRLNMICESPFKDHKCCAKISSVSTLEKLTPYSLYCRHWLFLLWKNHRCLYWKHSSSPQGRSRLFLWLRPPFHKLSWTRNRKGRCTVKTKAKYIACSGRHCNLIC